jgi:serine protease inhibitor
VRTRKQVATTAAVIAVLSLGACAGAPREHARLDRPVEFVGVLDKSWTDDGMAAASVRLATELVAASAGANAVVSPLSLQLVLAVLREGASGRVAEQLDAAVGLPDGGGSQVVADLRARLARFEGDVATVDRDNPPDRPLMHIADGVFIQPGFAVEPTFLERAAAYHRAQVYEADFADGRAKPLLDAWVKRETGGLLTQAPAAPDRDALVALIDTVTFAASWQYPFAPEGTHDGPFGRADGTTVQVPMMHQSLSAGYAAGQGWRAVELPYADGFAMRIVLPDGGALSEEQWLAVRAALDAAPKPLVDLTMPRWETDASLDLTTMLPQLGLDALPDPSGDLDGVFHGAAVSGVAQAATITVAERGTVAAAATEVVMVGSAAPQTPDVVLNLDRPFEYQVVDEETGLVVFAGRVADPS